MEDSVIMNQHVDNEPNRAGNMHVKQSINQPLAIPEGNLMAQAQNLRFLCSHIVCMVLVSALLLASHFCH